MSLEEEESKRIKDHVVQEVRSILNLRMLYNIEGRESINMQKLGVAIGFDD